MQRSIPMTCARERRWRVQIKAPAVADSRQTDSNTATQQHSDRDSDTLKTRAAERPLHSAAQKLLIHCFTCGRLSSGLDADLHGDPRADRIKAKSHTHTHTAHESTV